MERKKEIKELIKLIAATFIGVAVIILAFYINYENIRDHLISKEQQQLLTISKSVSRSLEQYFDYHSEKLQIITKNQLFKEQFEKYITSGGSNTKFNSLEDYFIIQEHNIDRIQLLNLDSQVIDQYPKNDSSIHPYLYNDIQRVLKMKSSVVSRVYSYNGEFFIRLYEPVFYNSKIKAVLCIQVKLEKIYEQFVKPVRTGKGYASVKDQHGILLMHPKKEDIGKHVISARKQEFPDYDWSELEALVEKQMNGESGVGIYHSIWYHDKNKKRVKKFSAYSPARVGDQFWIVTVSMDYVEITKFIRDQTYKTVRFITIVVLIFISCMFYIYKIKKDKKQLEKEARLLKQVNKLNIELEKDIEERKSLEKELIRNKEKYERLFNSGSDCIFVLNLDENNLPTEFLEVNKKACESLGYDKTAFLNMSYLDISKDSNIDKFKHMVETLKRNQFMIFEDILITSSGKAIPVEVNAHLFKLENQMKLILISRDITNRKIQEEALKRSEERFRKIINQVATEISVSSQRKSIDIYEAERKPSTYYSDIENKNRIALELERINIKLEEMFQKEVDENKKKEALMIFQSRLAAMGEMIGNIAHQWRQPLSGLGLIFSNIQDSYKYGELTQEYLEELVKKSNRLINRMSQTIDDFRYFFNPKSEEEIFSVKENIESTIDFLEEHLRLNGIALNIDVIEDGMIYGHTNQYSQVIFNIVQNAIDALIKNRLNKRKIDIKIFAEGYNQVVEIQDNGKGIDENIINDVFKPYFTTKSKGEGTGLGLYMSKVIIEKNFHGSINICNKDDGLCVSIVVPRNGVDSDEDKKKGILYNLKVLYVEDEEFVREQLATFIKRRVGKLYLATDGEEGLIKFNKYNPDIVITDLRMPKIDGIEMAKKIRNIDNICPIIITTAISDVESIIHTIDVGIDKYIVKPIDTKELVETMEKAALKLYKIKSKETIINSIILEKDIKKDLETKVQTAMAKFIKSSTGKGPKNVQAFIQGDILTIQFFETRTPLENTLLENPQNLRLVDYNRESLFKDKSNEIESIIKDILNTQVEIDEIIIDSKLDIDQIKFKIYTLTKE